MNIAKVKHNLYGSIEGFGTCCSSGYELYVDIQKFKAQSEGREQHFRPRKHGISDELGTKKYVAFTVRCSPSFIISVCHFIICNTLSIPDFVSQMSGNGKIPS